MGTAERRRTTARRLATGVSDELLAAAAAAGDRQAFEDLVRRHQRPLVSYLYRMIGNLDAATDLAQDVFVKVYVSIRSYDATYRFTTWLYRIASNGAIDHLRRRGPRTLLLQDEADPSEPSVTARASGPSPLDEARYRELERRVEKAVLDLPPSYRQLILLRHRGQCRYDEIARMTRLPIGTVKNRIFRAREILRRSLADVLDGGA